MFDRGLDQAAGLRQLFGASKPVLIPLGCASDVADRGGAAALASALARSGRRTLLIDLLGPASDADAYDAAQAIEPVMPRRDGESVVRVAAHRRFGPHSTGADLLAQIDDWRERGARGGAAFQAIVVAAHPLYLADLTASLSDRMLLLARSDANALAQAYSQIKAVRLAHGLAHWLTTFRDVRTADTALSSHRRLADTAARFLGAAVDFGGVVASGTFGTSSWDRFAADALHWMQQTAAPVPRPVN